MACPDDLFSRFELTTSSVEVVPLTYPLHERVGIPYVPLTATPY